MKQAESHGPHVSALALFLTFSRISLSGFGGVPFWARRVLVERKRWLTGQEFVELAIATDASRNVELLVDHPTGPVQMSPEARVRTIPVLVAGS